MRADATSLSRIVLRHLPQGHTNTGQFVFEQADQDAVRPLANFLISVSPHIYAFTNIAHVTYCQYFYLLSLTESDSLTTGLVQNITLLSVAFSRCFALAPGQFLTPSATFLTTREQAVEVAMPFVAELLDASQSAACNNLTSFTVLSSHSDEVNFTQVATCYLWRDWLYNDSIGGIFE